MDHVLSTTNLALFLPAVLGLIMVTVAIFSDSCYAFAAGTAGRWLRGSWLFLRIQRYLTGGVYSGLGMIALFAGGSKNT